MIQLTQIRLLEFLNIIPDDLLILHDRPQRRRLGPPPSEVIDPRYGEAIRRGHLRTRRLADLDVEVLVGLVGHLIAIVGTWVGGPDVVQLGPVVGPV